MKSNLQVAIKPGKETTIGHKVRSAFVGSWAHEYSDSGEVFSLNITQHGNKLIGMYCDVFDRGNKMDCADEGEQSFTLTVPQTKSFTTAYASSYSKARGLVEITVSGKQLIWHVIRRPKGENYCPRDAVLTK